MLPTEAVMTSTPSVAAYCALRSLMGWGVISQQQAACALENSLAFAGVYDADRLVAMGRVVGDGALFFYVQDVVVHPGFRSRGLGVAVMQSLELSIAALAQPGATVALLSAQGRESFYQRFGYVPRDGVGLGLGLGMSRVIGAVAALDTPD